jgi:L,D-peptidoglycan transpeptidase YkuD (ErfK/YbiS/YcfS/YnhG family)
MASRWPWRAVDDRDRFVDDPGSPAYNTWQRVGAEGRGAEFRSAEQLRNYELAIVVQHNVDPVQPGAGSAIFLHTWRGPKHSTSGCTAMNEEALRTVLAWLEPSADPVLVQVPGVIL